MDRSDVLIIGGGIAGITTALELLDGGKAFFDEIVAMNTMLREPLEGAARVTGSSACGRQIASVAHCRKRADPR